MELLVKDRENIFMSKTTGQLLGIIHNEESYQFILESVKSFIINHSHLFSPTNKDVCCPVPLFSILTIHHIYISKYLFIYIGRVKSSYHFRKSEIIGTFIGSKIITSRKHNRYFH